MRSTQPPRTASWLLRHFGSSPNNESVMGDLDERYRQGCSYLWYWRQAVLAIVTGLFNEVATHKLLTFRAIATGWAVAVVSRRAFHLTWELLSALASWSRLWRHHWITIAVQIPEVVLSGLLAGWLVARLHRQRQKPMVLAYAAYFLTVQIASLMPSLLTGLRYYPSISVILFIIMTTVGVLVGGGVFTSRRAEDSSDGNRATNLG
jgi:hypothetical protein